VTNDTNDVAAAKPVRTRKVIQATCTKHGGARGFTNLVLTKRGGEIELDPHATGACVLRLDEAAATAVRDQLTEWLG
jgi:hypothetical protein